MPDVSVIVPARDAARTLPRALDALAAQEGEIDYEVIVVDDGSRDGTAAIARAAGPPVVAIEQAPSGPAAARNRGAARAGAEVLAFCDADVFPTPGWLGAGLEAIAKADIVQGAVSPDPSAELGPFDRTIWISAPVLWEAANLFVRRTVFERVGGFPAGIVPRDGKMLAEDVSFGYASLRIGARPAFSSAALAHHAVFPRRWDEYVRERGRLRHFPAMARAVPELRSAFFYRRFFLDSRSARLDLALAGAAMSVATRSPLGLVAAGPYLKRLRAHAGRARPHGPGPAMVAAADMAADLTGLVALLTGSLRDGSLLI